jgi:SAM-dependent methyltransferase
MDVTCLLCGVPATPELAFAPLPLARCAACGFLFRPGLADRQATKDLYEGGAYEDRPFARDYASEQSISERRANAASRLRFVRRHATGGRLLDAGAAGGAFVLEAREAGFAAQGIEPAPAFARHARETLGVDVRDGRLEDLAGAGETWDVITLWHVLEHVPDPVGALRILRDVLAPGGVVVLEVPNVDSTAARMLGVGWTHLDPEAHVSHFGPATLRVALERAGLRVAWTGTVAHSAYLQGRERLAPRALAHRVKLAARGGALGSRDATRHEFLRAVAQR